MCFHGVEVQQSTECLCAPLDAGKEGGRHSILPIAVPATRTELSHGVIGSVRLFPFSIFENRPDKLVIHSEEWLNW